MPIRTSLGATVLLAASAVAQMMPPVRQPFPQLKQFLTLTDAQINALQANLEAEARAVADKQTRIFELHKEIAEETAKQRPDASAIGTRYVEIEMICRELRDRGDDLQKTNLAVLTPEQKAKLKTLEDAQKLWPTVMEAQSARLLTGGVAFPGNRIMAPGTATFMFGQTGTQWFDTSTFNTAVPMPIAGCSMPPMMIRQPMPISVGGGMGLRR